MRADTFLERIQKKPTKKLNNSDVQTVLLQDIKSLLEQQVKLLDKNAKSIENSWWKKVFR